ncbi:fructose-2,6-bisphosphate 2-phosphatase activity [Schizosaccharomyces japonicus yFS275]|uniref:fructose-2,6-bisphosphate 2-phosphatase n=1 Tax=Schizosaccharomyces japonicus (strain yFS275 / FY16936) TaxID=402676 RepID=B6K0Z5_SCHJY|nr:fructose-2,6-bisphosphate 2-phosphatase activity [Schizosaccharomyces japonicus yFS275]EEB07616.1 fructose-2,6-bisphosphate 2-phosphatase activity [Schizosaccharomyces japonicus yFS275]
MSDPLSQRRGSIQDLLAALNDTSRLCLCFVGLPARRKTFTAKKLSRYLNWISVKTQLFEDNFGEDEKDNNWHSHRIRRWREALQPVGDFFENGGAVAILDFGECSKAFRQMVQFFCKHQQSDVMFIESVIHDRSILEESIADICQNCPTYTHQPFDEARERFLQYIAQKERGYEGLSEDEGCSYLKIIDVGRQTVIHKVSNYLQSKIVYYLSNLRVRKRSIWLSRHGESEFNVAGRIGGNSNLSSRGHRYAKLLPDFVAKCVNESDELIVWTSSMKRTIQTAQHIHYNKLEWKALDELNAGVCDGYTYEYVEDAFPDEAAARNNDKFHYRYRGGESYMDVVNRLEPIIMELERQGNVMIVCHQAILRCIYGYYHNFSLEDIPFIDMPLHTIIKLTPTAHNTLEERIVVPVPAVSTQRPRV